ncbi:MAG: PKD domain-containing protein [Bacteroidia bacterium]|nr:PKD domain-containing protein [Bacteroidia bacterium]
MKYTTMLSFLQRILLLGWGCLLPAFGQVSYQASYHQGAGNPGGLNQETDFNTVGWSELMGGSLLSNQWSNPGNIPFNFEFFGQQVSFFRVSANGLVTFDMTPSAPPGNNSLLPSALVPDSTIVCFWDQFTISPPTGSNDKVQTKIFGTAPNRQLWIRWESYEWGACSFAYLAVVLNEGSNKIHLVDLYSSTNASLVSATVGIQANAGFAVSAAHNVPLSGAGSGNSDNSYYTFTPYLIEPYDMQAVGITAPAGDGCGLGQESVSIKLSNVGLFTATGMTARLSVDGGSFSAPELIPGSLAPGDTISFTFATKANLSSIGSHSLKVVLSVAGDNNPLNDTMRTSLSNLVSVSTFPYQENFENGSGGWTPGGTNSSWAMGYANNPTIQGAPSGVNAWITGRTGTYNSNENSWVMSPCFDLTTLGPQAVISMNIWWESEYSWDGAVLQSSIDGGLSWQRVGKFGDGSNWYNDNTINSLPGGQPHGWSGQSAGGTGSGGWVRAQAKLGSALLGEPKVLFRFAFSSDGSSNLDGFAFDDVTIGNAPVINLGNNAFFCNGHQLDAGAANATNSIKWSTGATTQKITLLNATQGAIIDSMVTVSVTDSKGLVGHDTIIFSMTLPPTAQIVDVTKVACFGESTGAIDLNMAGGASPFTYAWSNGASVQDPTNLPKGTYSGEVIDINGCKAFIPSVTVTENPKLSPSANIESVLCHGDSTGSVQLGASGGVGPYQYLWTDGSTNSFRSQLAFGTYAVVVTDSKGCQKNLEAEVTQPEPLALSAQIATDANCIDSFDGKIDLTFDGGTTPYSYFWDHGSNEEDPTDLAPGSYSGYVLDSNNCFFQLPAFAISYSDSIPEAGFGFGMAGAQVGFKDSSQRAASYFWDFGDGQSSTDPQPGHLYEENGIFTVTQIVSNACGSDTITREVNIISASLQSELNVSVQLYPNPSKGSFEISLGATWAGKGIIAVHNINGQEVWSDTRILSPGIKIEVTLPQTLSKGLYLVSVKLGDQMIMKKLELR